MTKEKIMVESHAMASAEEQFKCSNCGHMYPTNGKDELPCPPVCGRVNKRGQDEIVMASTEEY